MFCTTTWYCLVKDMGAWVVITVQYLCMERGQPREDRGAERDVACSKGKWDDDTEDDCGPPYLGGFEMDCTKQHLGPVTS